MVKRGLTLIWHLRIVEVSVSPPEVQEAINSKPDILDAYRITAKWT
jgi:hypothetical protein